jgi:hypothetical protein
MVKNSKAARRPTKAMMLAVNAGIDGDDEQVERLIKEHKLDREELQARLMARDGSKYDLAPRKPRATRRAAPAAGAAAKPGRRMVDLEVAIDGRTSVRQLFKLIDQADRVRAAAQQELKRRSPQEIEPVKKALAEIELLRREHLKLQEKIRAAEDALG